MINYYFQQEKDYLLQINQVKQLDGQMQIYLVKVECKQNNLYQFDNFYSSDLKRSLEFANIVLGFNGTDGKKLLQIDRRLRELDFGEHDGSIYDLLPKNTQQEIDSIEYQAPQGESWMKLKNRMEQFFNELQTPGNYLIFTHGGSICSLTYQLGLQNMISPGSFVVLKQKNNVYDLVYHYENEYQGNV